MGIILWNLFLCISMCIRATFSFRELHGLRLFCLLFIQLASFDPLRCDVFADSYFSNSGVKASPHTPERMTLSMLMVFSVYTKTSEYLCLADACCC